MEEKKNEVDREGEGKRNRMEREETTEGFQRGVRDSKVVDVEDGRAATCCWFDSTDEI